MTYIDPTVQFHIYRSDGHKKHRNLRAALTSLATTAGIAAISSTIDPGTTAESLTLMQNIGLASTALGAIAGTILTGLSHSKYLEYFRLEECYENILSSRKQLIALKRRRPNTEGKTQFTPAELEKIGEIDDNIEYYKDLRDSSYSVLVNHFTKKFNINSTISKLTKGAAFLSATAGIVLPFISNMTPLADIATAATGIVVAGICGITASDCEKTAAVNYNVYQHIEDIYKNGQKPKPRHPGMTCVEANGELYEIY